MKVGDLVMQKVVHEDQEEPRLLMIIKTETLQMEMGLASPPSDHNWPLCVEVMDLELGTYTAYFDWQLEVAGA